MTLSAIDGTPVLDPVDLLSRSLRHSVVVLGECFSGRYLGVRTGEQLNHATVALFAGAMDVIAGLFAVPGIRLGNVSELTIIVPLAPGVPTVRARSCAYAPGARILGQPSHAELMMSR